MLDAKLDTMQQPAAQVGASLVQQDGRDCTNSKEMEASPSTVQQALPVRLQQDQHLQNRVGMSLRELLGIDKKMVRQKLKELKVRKCQGASVQQKIKS